MFDLENAIKNWKRQLRSSPAFEDGDIAELESHLRNEIDRLTAEGLSEEEAFQKASKEIGEPESIGDELYKTRTPNVDATPPWKQKSWLPTMLPNYVKVSLRNFKRNFAFSIINVLGLSVALAVALLVITFIKDQAGYDTFHSNADQIYRVITSPGGDHSASARYASSPFSIASLLKHEFPEVVQATHIKPFTNAVSFEDQRFVLSGYRADSSFFTLFDFNLDRGNPDNALKNPNSVILSKEAAERFFGDTNPMGKVLSMQNSQLYEVTGVLAEEQNRSHLEFEALISDSPNAESMMLNAGMQSWENPMWYTYLLLEQQTNVAEFESKLGNIVDLHFPGDSDSEYQLNLQRLTEINLGEQLSRQIGRVTPVEFVYFLAALAVVIILASSINYVNLTVARSLKRVKEIGLRKVIGAERFQIICQFIIESILIAVISLSIGLLIFWSWLLPFWNSLQLATADFGQIAFNTSRDAELYLIFLGFSVLVGLLAGIYPAIKLSSFSPSEAFKNSLTNVKSSGWSLRKMLVVLQITISLVLIISTFLLYRQSSELLNAEYGFSKSDVINVELGEVPYELMRQEMTNQSGVEGISATSSLPGVNFPTKTWIGREDRLDSLSASIYSVDESFNKNFKLNLIAGRNFSSDYAVDTLEAAILNETAVQKLGIGSPREAIDTFIEIKRTGHNYQIVGVVEDFQFDFLWNPISPMIMLNNPSGYRIMNIHLAESNQATTLQNLERIWKQIEPVAPFNYRYYQNEIDTVYTDFRELVFLVGFLAILAILIACFGMLAMSHYDTQARIKEIGVRKVFGANVKDVIVLLSADFAKIIILGIVIGIPAAVYLNSLWLQVFANKTDFSIWLIVGATILTAVLTLISISWQTYNAALRNPVKSLRSE